MLDALGWTPADATAFEAYEQDHIPGRIAVEGRDIYLAYSTHGEMWAEMSGRLRHEATEREDRPAVGDFVALKHREGDRATI
ncbi:MAG: ribosome small subunit-dependent GTPase, partial [Actinomycetota bacterium]